MLYVFASLFASANGETIVFQTLEVPKIMYGTAWKKDATKRLVVKALQTGYRDIDTACQPKHYNERGVGEALSFQSLCGVHMQTH